MPSQSGSEAGRRLLVAAGTEHFKKLDNLDLPGVPGELARIVETFATLGYEHLPITLDPDHSELKTLFADVKEASRAGDHVVAYYSGHGSRDEDEERLSSHLRLGPGQAGHDSVTGRGTGARADQAIQSLTDSGHP